MKLEINKSVDLGRLQQEFIDANLIDPLDYFGEDFIILKINADVELAQEIIANHEVEI